MQLDLCRAGLLSRPNNTSDISLSYAGGSATHCACPCRSPQVLSCARAALIPTATAISAPAARISSWSATPVGCAVQDASSAPPAIALWIEGLALWVQPYDVVVDCERAFGPIMFASALGTNRPFTHFLPREGGSIRAAVQVVLIQRLNVYFRSVRWVAAHG
jgi:hypothetical protein